MKIICKQNCSGKTKELIRESLDKDFPILVFNDSKKKSLEEKSIAYFSQLVRTLTIDEAKSYQGNVLIDDIDKSLSLLVKVALQNNNIDVDTVTMSA